MLTHIDVCVTAPSLNVSVGSEERSPALLSAPGQRSGVEPGRQPDGDLRQRRRRVQVERADGEARVRVGSQLLRPHGGGLLLGPEDPADGGDGPHPEGDPGLPGALGDQLNQPR